MSKNRYSQTSMYELAKTLSRDELFSKAMIASQKGHLCNGHCFCCVCREIYNERETILGLIEYNKDLEAVIDLAKDILMDNLIDMVIQAKKSRDCEKIL